MRIRELRTLPVIGAASLFLAAVAAAADYDRDAALAASQQAIGISLPDTVFRDARGQPFRLTDLAGRPVIVSLIYTSCHHVCPLLTDNLQQSVAIARDALGSDAFAVVTIGFDWRVDTPEQMRIYATSRGIHDADWHFLSGDESSVRAISDAVGFEFFESAKGYDHLSQTTIVDAGGRVYRQVYGERFEVQALVEPLKELVFDTPRDAGLIEHWVDTFRFFCTVYDPNSGRYLFDYSIFMTIVLGVLCLGAVLAFVVHEWRRAV